MAVVQTERCAIQVKLEAQICLHDLLGRLYTVHFLRAGPKISTVTFKGVDCIWVAQSAITWIHLVGPVIMPTTNHAHFSGNVW